MDVCVDIVSQFTDTKNLVIVDTVLTGGTLAMHAQNQALHHQIEELKVEPKWSDECHQTVFDALGGNIQCIALQPVVCGVSNDGEAAGNDAPPAALLSNP